MFKVLSSIWLLGLILFPASFLSIQNGVVVHAQENEVEEEPAEDLMEDEDNEESNVEVEDEATDAETAAVKSDEEEETEEDSSLRPSPDAETVILFTKPASTEFPAGSTVHLLAGFKNKGEKEFVVDTIEAAFVHPQDFRYYMLNFTRASYMQKVESQRHATFEYMFPIREDLADRPFGLIVTLNYSNEGGEQFLDVLYNDTITIREPDEGFDGETFFLYVVLAALVVLILVGAQQVLSSLKRKHLNKPKPVEMGTKRTDIDYDWIPESTVRHMKGSPGRSPRQRKVKRGKGAEE